MALGTAWMRRARSVLAHAVRPGQDDPRTVCGMRVDETWRGAADAGRCAKCVLFIEKGWGPGA